MDLFTILFAIAFVLLPLLQKIFGKADEEADVPPEDSREPQQRVGEAGGWSTDWGDWPEEVPAAEEEVVEMLPEEAFSHEMRVPEAVRVASPVVSMEPLHVDHSVDYQRSSTKKAPSRPARTRRPKYSVHAPTHAQALRDPKGLRRALVLSEILGPPRALDPHER